MSFTIRVGALNQGVEFGENGKGIKENHENKKRRDLTMLFSPTTSTKSSVISQGWMGLLKDNCCLGDTRTVHSGTVPYYPSDPVVLLKSPKWNKDCNRALQIECYIIV